MQLDHVAESGVGVWACARVCYVLSLSFRDGVSDSFFICSCIVLAMQSWSCGARERQREREREESLAGVSDVFLHFEETCVASECGLFQSTRS